MGNSQTIESEIRPAKFFGALFEISHYQRAVRTQLEKGRDYNSR